ncbi:2,3-diphosphoglycerate-dependent phosphoglycerate mutase [Saccharophagus degradans]|uniref:2,3-bisphosphoglycerate-dependent phosphoglycerate mutase n=1 Tax=Saccharophagus degradans TaxID=86304 RepID=UPI002477DFB9|nr:2,3-diphosphoglycerate-dependent phosphoglycerate mutase [Saccharophagus degradans]WGP00441.1 2,3-diphosphoglycerate-dependent phosphoglycerate mutase [Saccharophagus degradans]
MTDQKVIMIRHAQSEWNAKGLFTGWADPVLTPQGRKEAVEAASNLAKLGLKFDRIYTSVLQRATETASIIAKGLNCQVPLTKSWQLNERHYGVLQGKSKEALAKQVGTEQVWRWRRGFEDMPPPMPLANPMHARFDTKYDGLEPTSLPSVESLKHTQIRAVNYWQKEVLPSIRNNSSVLVAAHGNTLRALIMYLANMSVQEVEGFEIPTGIPIELNINKHGRCSSWRYV